MGKIKYEKQTYDGRDIFYEIMENGFSIYIGNTIRPAFYQPEPYIPYPELSYEENAKKMCEECTIEQVTPFQMTEEKYMEMVSNIDYLLLLNE